MCEKQRGEARTRLEIGEHKVPRGHIKARERFIQDKKAIAAVFGGAEDGKARPLPFAQCGDLALQGSFRETHLGKKLTPWINAGLAETGCDAEVRVHRVGRRLGHNLHTRPPGGPGDATRIVTLPTRETARKCGFAGTRWPTEDGGLAAPESLADPFQGIHHWLTAQPRIAAIVSLAKIPHLRQSVR